MTVIVRIHCGAPSRIMNIDIQFKFSKVPFILKNIPHIMRSSMHAINHEHQPDIRKRECFEYRSGALRSTIDNKAVIPGCENRGQRDCII